MEYHGLLFNSENYPCKSEVKDDDEQEKMVDIKLEIKPDLDEKFDVLTPLIFDIVKLDTKPEIDEKLDVLTPVVILDLVAFKSESLNEEVKLEDDLVKEEYFSGDDINNTDSKEIEEFCSLSSEERCIIVPIRKHEEGHIVANKKRNAPDRETQLTNTTMKKYIRERKFECYHCGKKFTQGDVLKSHIRIHTGERPYVCSCCKNTYRTKNLLKNHVQLHNEKRFKCDYCEKTFQQNFKLKCHLLIHMGNKPVYTCYACNKNYSSKSLLKRHINEIHLGQLRKQVWSNLSKSRVTCSECNKEISCKKNLKLHWKRCHETTSCSFTCDHCKKSFPEKLHLRSHINKTHLDSKPVICQYCTKTLKNDYYLKVHVKNHHQDKKSTLYVCDVCQMAFRKSAYLNRHRQTHTDKDKTVVCDTCGQKCRSKSDMRYHVMTHIKNAHKPFKCDKCSMAFFKAAKLKRHQLVHYNVKPYKCQNCEKTYKDTSSLKIHQNTVHLNASFTCHTCGFHSINEGSFKRHLRQNLCSKKLLTSRRSKLM